ncbi:DUF4238 domain-containing protein [Deinococcus sp. JMULE3]|uniref:DUF4238 domain-containing protein n=1 Tax=Deinococcus sp. JMULE3 TaxID=2518341 RepID=UPI0015769EF0|nr:DUF4238 domain-containing protein [Deinococcus sp. JMULE3]NTX99331.1 DUF4238 domain-containing protein [Deinococcus sp. JMULE3]
MGQKQHYVPKSYLRNFLNNESGNFVVYDKLSNSKRLGKANNQIAAEDDFYKANPSIFSIEVDDNVIEKFFSEHADSRPSKFPEYCADLGNGRISIERFKELCVVYIYFQFVRVPQELPKERRSEESKIDHIRYMFNRNRIERFTRRALSAKWVILKGSNEFPIFTSDNPVIPFYNNEEGASFDLNTFMNKTYDIGSDAFSFNFIFPITKDYIIYIYDSEERDTFSSNGSVINLDEALYRKLAMAIANSGVRILIFPSDESFTTAYHYLDFELLSQIKMH